jgi:hypothetical protein
MGVLDERVLGRDEAATELRRVVLDPTSEPAPLQLREQAELAELREPHRLPRVGAARRAPRG